MQGAKAGETSQACIGSLGLDVFKNHRGVLPEVFEQVANIWISDTDERGALLLL
jgi:hypothetical protein